MRGIAPWIIAAVVAAVVIIGVAAYFITKKPTAPPTQPSQPTTQPTTPTTPTTPTQPNVTQPTPTEGDKLTNVPEGVTGETTQDNVYYAVWETGPDDTLFKIKKVGLKIDLSSGDFELQILMENKDAAQEALSKISTALHHYATVKDSTVVPGDKYAKLVFKGTATDIDGLKNAAKVFINW